jgi:hypothetical protein
LNFTKFYLFGLLIFATACSHHQTANLRSFKITKKLLNSKVIFIILLIAYDLSWLNLIYLNEIWLPHFFSEWVETFLKKWWQMLSSYRASFSIQWSSKYLRKTNKFFISELFSIFFCCYYKITPSVILTYSYSFKTCILKPVENSIV